MAQIKISVKDITGVSIKDTSVVFNLNRHGLIERITDELGKTSISGIEVGEVPVTVNKDKYQSQSFVLKIIDEDQIISKETIMLSNVNKEKPKETAGKVIETTSNIVAPFVFNQPKTIDDAKKAYKEIEKNIESQKGIIDKALKDGVHNIVQQQASNLTYTLGQQLTASIHWYVKERSKLDPLGSLEDLGRWASMTSMVAGLFFLRSSLVEYINKLLEKLGKGI